MKGAREAGGEKVAAIESAVRDLERRVSACASMTLTCSGRSTGRVELRHLPPQRQSALGLAGRRHLTSSEFHEEFIDCLLCKHQIRVCSCHYIFMIALRPHQLGAGRVAIHHSDRIQVLISIENGRDNFLIFVFTCLNRGKWQVNIILETHVDML